MDKNHKRIILDALLLILILSGIGFIIYFLLFMANRESIGGLFGFSCLILCLSFLESVAIWLDRRKCEKKGLIYHFPYDRKASWKMFSPYFYLTLFLFVVCGIRLFIL